MDSQVQTAALTLASLLEQNQEDIANIWTIRIFQTASFCPGDHWVDVLRLSTRQGLEAMRLALATGSFQKLEVYLSQLSSACLRGGFECGDTAQALLMCREAILPVIRRSRSSDADLIWAMISELDRCLHWMVQRFVSLYIAETMRRLRGQRERKLALLRSSLQTPDLLATEDVLRQTAFSLITDLEVECCDIYLFDRDHNQLNPVLGMSASAAIGPVRLYENQLVKPQADPLLRQMLEQGEPVACWNVQQAAQAGKTGLRATNVKSILAVPLPGHGQVLAVAIAGVFSDYREFTPEQIELAQEIARDAALALENIRLQEKRRLENQSIQRVMAVLLQDLDLDGVLRIVCEEAQHLTGSRGSAVYLLSENGQRLILILNTGDRPVSTQIPVEGSLAGMALHEGRIFVSNNPASDERLCVHNGNIVNVLVAPLLANGMRIGVLYAANKPQDFSEDDVRVLSVLAGQAAIAIEHARLLDKIRYIAILEERERLAREIHDNLAQALSVLKLQASSVGDLLLSGQFEQARHGVQEMVQTAAEAHIDAREAIFNLRNRIAAGENLPAVLEACLERYRNACGIDVRLDVQDISMALLSDTMLLQIVRIIQEALTNVRKHAEASSASIHVYEHAHQLVVVVEDNGRGFDVEQARHCGVGLQVMKERAASLGGYLEIHTATGHGTRIKACIPLGERRHWTHGAVAGITGG